MRSGGQSLIRYAREISLSITLIVENEVPIFDSEDKKNTAHFNGYFVLQTELPVSNVIPRHPTLSDKAIFIRSASEEQVLEVMKGVDISKACGYDGFMVIRLLNYEVRDFMFIFSPFINFYYSLGHYPSE